MKKDLLTIGSVVKLIGMVTPVMIIGYFPIDPEKRKTYDYWGTSYVTGVVNYQNMIMFDHTLIYEVEHEGYCNETAVQLLDMFHRVAEEQPDFKEAMVKDLLGE